VKKMTIEKAKAELHAAMSGPAGRHWNYGPAVSTVLAALEHAEQRIAELEEHELLALRKEREAAVPAVHRWRRVSVEPYGPYPWHYGDFIGFSDPVEGIEDENFYGAPPPQPVAMPDDYFAALVSKARPAAEKAMRKFPQPNYVLLKVAEEAGEVVQAGVHYAEKRMSWEQVEGEIVQLLAMLIRLVTEGDQINGVTPPENTRAAAPQQETNQ